ncbi:protein phosphatase 1 regulatory subunit 35 [Hoplias malabaricus]|uniref:protein phosphatase 1 regulatory subunit 35 n=1 Tax=Hoplias malabaricus TaxID=27720 RepID=UPI00346223E4
MDSAVCGVMLIQMTPPPLPLSPAPFPPQCPELDLSLTQSPDRPSASAGGLKKGHTHTQPRKVRFNVSPEPTTATPPPCNSQSASSKASKRIQAQRKLEVEAQGEELQQLDEGAGLNTILALRAEIQQLEGEEFDSQKAVQEKLQNSAVARENVGAKAAEGLNIPRSQHLYRSLVSVDLSHDQIVSELLRDRPTLAPPTTTYKLRSPPAEGPDLLMFHSKCQLVREMPLLQGNQLPWPRPCPKSRPAHATFHLHQRHGQWEL